VQQDGVDSEKKKKITTPYSFPFSREENESTKKADLFHGGRSRKFGSSVYVRVRVCASVYVRV